MNFDTVMLGVVIVVTVLICVGMWIFPSFSHGES